MVSNTELTCKHATSAADNARHLCGSATLAQHAMPVPYQQAAETLSSSLYKLTPYVNYHLNAETSLFIPMQALQGRQL